MPNIEGGAPKLVTPGTEVSSSPEAPVTQAQSVLAQAATVESGSEQMPEVLAKTLTTAKNIAENINKLTPEVITDQSIRALQALWDFIRGLSPTKPLELRTKMALIDLALAITLLVSVVEPRSMLAKGEGDQSKAALVTGTETAAEYEYKIRQLFPGTKPAFGPNGVITFVRQDLDTNTDVLIEASPQSDGSFIEKIIKEAGYLQKVEGITFSPDGQQIFFMSEGDPNTGLSTFPALYTMNIDGTGVRALAGGGTFENPTRESISDAKWVLGKPSYIVATIVDSSNRSDIVFINPSNGERTPLPPQTGEAKRFSATPSPDGKFLAVIIEKEGIRNKQFVELYRIDGAFVKPVTIAESTSLGGFWQKPVWSADSSKVIIENQIINTKTGEVTALPEGILFPTWSQDGSKLAYFYGGTSRLVVSGENGENPQEISMPISALPITPPIVWYNPNTLAYERAGFIEELKLSPQAPEEPVERKNFVYLPIVTGGVANAQSSATTDSEGGNP